MRSNVQKRSVVIAGHKTSVSLEDAFWDVLKGAAARSGRSLGQLVEEIDDSREVGVNLSSAIRLFALDHVRQGAAQA